MDETESRVEVIVTTDTSVAPHKAGESKLYVMFDAAKPEAGKLYFTEAEWDAFVLGVKDGEFDLDEDGNLPPLPESQHQNSAARPDEPGRRRPLTRAWAARPRRPWRPRHPTRRARPRGAAATPSGRRPSRSR